MCKDGTASGADASVFANDIPGPDVAAPRENIYDVVSKESWYKCMMAEPLVLLSWALDVINGVTRPTSEVEHKANRLTKEYVQQSPLVILVVGASGDLAKKKTYPALFALWQANLLPQETTIYGFARSVRSHDEIRESIRYGDHNCFVLGSCSPQLITSPFLLTPGVDTSSIDKFLCICFYKHGASYGDASVITTILDSVVVTNLLVYLAIPPHVFGDATLAVKKALEVVSVSGFRRVVLEKPFGRDTESCRALLNILKEQEWDEADCYRIDHYLGKDMVQTILPLRQNNPWLDAIWNRNVVQSVHIIFKEPFGTEGRGGYFDPYGIIRDILQNHLMQVLTLIAMDLPTGDISADKVRDAKVAILKAMPVIEARDCLLGQYDGYKDDKTIEDRNTTTPTFACVRAWVNSNKWRGVPFVLEAGKALDERLCEARLHFRGNNTLVLRLQPKPAVFFTTNVKEPGFSESSMTTQLGMSYNSYHRPLPEAYTKLVLDALRGRQGNFVRDDELLESWKLFSPSLRQHEPTQPAAYTYGSQGPSDRNNFLKAMGVGVPSLPIPSSL